MPKDKAIIYLIYRLRILLRYTSILFFFLIVGISIFFYEPFSQTYGQTEEITIDLKTNPNKVNVGDKYMLIISLKNEANATAGVTSLKIISPWETRELEHPNLLSPNRIFVSSVKLEVPENATAGVYDLAVVTSTKNSDHIGHTQLSVDAIQAIPLSGEIPLSIIALITPGILTYFIIIFFLTNKFERSYVEIGIVSASFGILNWFIFSYFTGRNIFLSLRSSPIEYIQVFLLAAGIGLLIIFTIKSSQFFYRKSMESYRLRKFHEALLIRGYARIEKPVWVLFMEDQMEVARSFGSQFTTHLQVFLKSGSQDRLHFPVLYGLLRRYEEEPPYHIALRPKYTIKCSKEELVKVLINDSTQYPNPLRRHLENKKFFEKFSEFIRSLNDDKNIHSIDEVFGVAKRLLSTISAANIPENQNVEALARILEEKFDFGTYVEEVIRLIEKNNPTLEVYQRGEHFSFIEGDDISVVEVMRYETPYSIIIKETNREIPRPHDFKPL